ncbi:MAG TPA: sensor histidine kinase [Actinomycetota bacterium]|nr:sensor histidine kinase [Actinomycetota bacterium]
MKQQLGIQARLRRLDPRLVDGFLALLIAIVSLPGIFPAVEGSRRDADGWSLALILLMTLPIAYRRIAPDVVMGTTGLATVAYYALGYPDTLAAIGTLIALYSIAAHGTRKIAVQALIGTVIGLSISVLATELGDLTLQILISNYIIYGTAWVIGDNMRTRRAYTQELEARADRLERERETQSRDAVIDERRRIAREMHDVVAHNVSVMVVQAGAARRIIESKPEQARDALSSIEMTGRQALTEMRRLTGVLRREEESYKAPQPGLNYLEKLIEQTREAGLPVEVTIEGEPYELPQGADLSAFRIVQEALTNSLKHAGPSQASVCIKYSPDKLELRVTDNGRGAAERLSNGSVAGHGLVGMRERVAMFGGDLKSGPLPGGGYEVQATLPLEIVAQ